MKRYFALIPLTILALLLDCFVFTRVTFFGICPSMLTAVVLAACAITCVQDALVLGTIGGLLIDIFCNPYAGLTAAATLAAVATLHLFIRKNKPKQFVLFLYCCAAAAVREAIILLFSLIVGARFDFLRTILLQRLPSVILTALLALPIAALLTALGKSRRDRI